jgi:hypothetical protein
MRIATPPAARPSRILLLSVLLLAASACASKPPPAAARPQRARPARVAWLPVEPLVAPALASALNEHMARIALPGADASYRAPVSMEVGQLAIECIDATPACYAKVGRSVGADRVIWAEIAPAKAPSADIRVALLLFDVDAGAVIGRAERTFPGAKEAAEGIGTLVDHAFAAERSGAAPAGRGGRP